MNDFSASLQGLKAAILPVRSQLLSHPVFFALNSLDKLKVFMEYHIYAVWDFMSLLKALQARLTCITIPWFPQGSPLARYFINEIVMGEESDLHYDGRRISHFELYLEAMQEIGCATEPVIRFLEALKEGRNLEQACMIADVPGPALSFMQTTFNCIRSDKPHLLAAAFTLGREDLIPDMFLQLVRQLEREFPAKVKTFKYYLERHIEVDGQHHSILAYQMLEELCQDSATYWAEAQNEVLLALDARKSLWDGVYQKIIS
jgi:pyrroloquinoline quinone (PQQ) biosynthesis protein C